MNILDFKKQLKMNIKLEYGTLKNFTESLGCTETYISRFLKNRSIPNEKTLNKMIELKVVPNNITRNYLLMLKNK